MTYLILAFAAMAGILVAVRPRKTKARTMIADWGVEIVNSPYPPAMVHEALIRLEYVYKRRFGEGIRTRYNGTRVLFVRPDGIDFNGEHDSLDVVVNASRNGLGATSFFRDMITIALSGRQWTPNHVAMAEELERCFHE